MVGFKPSHHKGEDPTTKRAPRILSLCISKTIHQLIIVHDTENTDWTVAEAPGSLSARLSREALGAGLRTSV